MNKTVAVPIFIVLIFLFIAVSPVTSRCDIIKSDTTWSGEVSVTSDVLVPEGVVLTIMPGTVIHITSSETTKTDPEYMSPLIEITVRGLLKAEGSTKAPIKFSLAQGQKPGGWAGIIADGGRVRLASCAVHDAETGVYAVKGSVDIKEATISNNRYGIAATGPEVQVRIEKTNIKDNDYGIFTLRGAKVQGNNNTVQGNRKKDVYSSRSNDYKPVPVEYSAEKTDKSRIYGDEVVRGTAVWQGRIEVKGVVRVPADGRLIIMPGTVVEFVKKDTNNDGLGENGLMIQGVIIAKGTKERPIFFRSAEKRKVPGDWDAINIMNSDGVQNLIEYCQIEDAYRGLHFHFSNVAIRGAVLRNNYRAVQFQESTVLITGNHIHGNNSGLQARDSEVVFTNNQLFNNGMGANLFRVNISARGNSVVNNYREGLRVREGIPVFEENLIDANRYGLMLSDLVYGSFSRNVISNNIEAGVSVKGVDNTEISGNFIFGNGFNGINIQDSRAIIKGNHISGNLERGLGIMSFDGTVTENNIVKNGLYAIDNEGRMDISAPMNWWDAKDIKPALFDKEDDASRGKVLYGPASERPFPFSWPLGTISTEITWFGDIVVPRTVNVLKGATLRLTPNTSVFFSEGAGLRVSGKIVAPGLSAARILFTSLKKKEASAWDEVLLEYATGSIFSNCDFEFASWGLHSHFTNLLVSGSRFRKNYGGIRFRSGPAEIRGSLFEENHIGLRSYLGNALIEKNVITQNDIGIFVREKGGGLSIRENNIFSNTDYNVRIGDFNKEDVDARNNWWGDVVPSDTVFDERLEPGIGRVLYEPYATGPFKTDLKVAR